MTTKQTSNGNMVKIAEVRHLELLGDMVDRYIPAIQEPAGHSMAPLEYLGAIVESELEVWEGAEVIEPPVVLSGKQCDLVQDLAIIALFQGEVADRATAAEILAQVAPRAA